MRHLLAVGPFAWKTLGVFPGDWKDCEIHEANGEVDALRRLRSRAFDVVVTHPTTTAAHDLLFIHDAMQQQPGLRPIVIAPELTPADVIAALRQDVYACFAPPVDAIEIRLACFTVPSGRTFTFAGLRSRWMMPTWRWRDYCRDGQTVAGRAASPGSVAKREQQRLADLAHA